MRNVEKPSIRYLLLFRFVRLYFNIFYRKITVTGKDKIPANVPVIFASNHQNALMDALAMLFTTNRPIVFLARADIFKNERIAKLLHLIKILPVYRIRDGKENLGGNTETFDKTVQVLQSGTAMGILPEGSHTSIKRLQPLKKGICRMAFQAAESTDFKMNILIVPVGLDYTNYQHAGTHLLVNFGSPLYVERYYDLYRENPQKAISLLRDDLAEAMKKVMIHVENETHYHTIQSLTGIFVSEFLRKNGVPDNRVTRFSASREIIIKIENASLENKLDLNTVNDELTSYRNLLEKASLKDWLFESDLPSTFSVLVTIFLSVLLFPVHLYGMIINYLPYRFPVVISSKLKDPQFISSVNFGLSLIFFPVWYLLLFAALQLFPFPFLLDLSLLITWPLTGLFAFYHYIHLRKLSGKVRLLLLNRRQPELYQRIVEARKKIIDLVNSKL